MIQSLWNVASIPWNHLWNIFLITKAMKICSIITAGKTILLYKQQIKDNPRQENYDHTCVLGFRVGIVSANTWFPDEATESSVNKPWV